MLFSVLDHEMDATILSNIHDTLSFIMHSMASENLTTWLSLLREVLTIGSSESLEQQQQNAGGGKPDDDDDADAADDDDEFTTGEEEGGRDTIQPRWPTRVFAAKCLRRIIEGITEVTDAHPGSRNSCPTQRYFSSFCRMLSGKSYSLRSRFGERNADDAGSR